MRKALIALIVAAVAIALAYMVIGSWQAARLLDESLRVGAPTAQSSGWPAPQGPADIGYEGDPAAAFGYGFENVALDGELGPLPAWLIPPISPDTAKPWAIFVHGIGGRRENGYRFLPTLHEAGHPVLMLSYRNDGDAPADPSGLYAFGLTEWRDLDTAVRYARANGAPSVAIVAESMGGGIVGQFLRKSDAADTVSTLIVDAPALDFRTILTHQIRAMNLPLAPVLARGALWFSALSTPVRLGDADVSDVLAHFAGPIFLAHGTADSVVPIGDSDAMVARRDAVTQYLRTTAGHIQSWKEDPARFEAALAAFLEQHPAQ